MSTPELRHAPRFYRQWMLAGNPAHYIDRVVQDYGDFVHCRGLLDFYLINHPSLVKQVLKDTHRSFDKRSVIYDRFRNAFGNSLVVAEGEEWRRQRRTMAAVFTPKAVTRFVPMMQTMADDVVTSWRSQCASGDVFDIAREMQQATLAIAGRALFSNGFSQHSGEIARWTRAINRYSAKPPIPIVTDLWFPSRTNRRLKSALRGFHGFVGDLIAQRRTGDPGEDLLGILLQARDSETGATLSEATLSQEVLGMIIGGHDSSSTALSWLWYELSRHPEIEQRMFAEIANVGPLTIEGLKQLIYTQSVIEETMRLHPPFWFENRSAVEDLELGGVRIPKGAMLVFSRYSLHRHPEFWQEPEEFRPSRFARDQMENDRHSFAFVPFGGGPRICIGMHFAMQELLILVATIMRHYRIVVDASDRHRMGAALTMYPKHGVRARLRPR